MVEVTTIVDEEKSDEEGDATPPMSGEHVDLGDYAYHESKQYHLGEGSYGSVFKGFHKPTNQSVAIKKTSNSVLKADEIELMRRLHGEHLVNLLHFHPQEDYTYVVMELCDTDLGEHLAHGRLDAKNFMKVMDNLARGYEVLYNERIVHRDIKPDNILIRYLDHGEVNSDGPRHIASAKISDFGLSRMAKEDDDEEDGSMNNVAGTPLYMAPEVGANLLSHSEYNSKIDMWSIGCVLFECLSGNKPFDERSLCKLFLHAATLNYRAYRTPKLPEDAPEKSDEIVNSLLEIDAEKRLCPVGFRSMSQHTVNNAA